MPTSYGRNTSVQLSVASLASVITPKPRCKQCPETSSCIRQIELAFTEASTEGTLAEESINGEDGRHLQFLGRNKDLPFFMVRAGKDFYNPNATTKTTRQPAKTVEQQTTEKLSLYDVGSHGTERGQQTSDQISLVNFYFRI